MSRIKYTCKNCGWETSVVSQWADIKPKRCMNAKCNTSFIKDVDSLKISKPPEQAPKKPKASNVKTSSKYKGSGKSKQQSDENKADS